tara:strand:+ start:143 stop:466 length:324 start_codon:yes stop_codon:yes gene_type:complete
MKRLDLIELPGHIALLALDQPWLLSDHLADLGAHIMMVEEVAGRRSDPAMQTIIQRAKELMQTMKGDPEELAEFRQLVGVSLPWISRQPNFEIERAAKKFLAAYDKG